MSGPEVQRAQRLSAVRRILVVRRKALGDTLVTLPALLAMVQAFPRARIDLVVDRPFADLFTNMVREVKVLAWPPAPGISWLRGIFAAHYDLVIDYLGSPRTARWTARILAIAPGAQFAPQTTLLELADLLTNCDLFGGTDCGARHLATGLQVPTVTLFGPTDALSWNPEDPRHVSVRTGEPCSPCNLASCPLPDHPCMRQLSADMVLAAIATQLALADRNDRGLP